MILSKKNQLSDPALVFQLVDMERWIPKLSFDEGRTYYRWTK